MLDLLRSTSTPFVGGAYERGAILFRQDDPASSVMYIEHGRVYLSVTGADGREAICGLLGAGAFLGEEAITGQAVRLHTAAALSRTDVLIIASNHAVHLFGTSHVASDRLIAQIIASRERLEADLYDHLTHPVEQRLARALLTLADCTHHEPCGCVVPRISQTLLAEMVGTSRTRVNTILRKFARLGIIETQEGAFHITSALGQFVRKAPGK